MQSAPPRQIRVGNATVTIYTTATTHRVVWRQGGQRRMRGIRDARRAEDFSRELASTLDTGDQDHRVLSRVEADEWAEARRLAGRHGRSVLGAVREWIALTARHGTRQTASATISELAREIALARRQDGATPQYCSRIQRELLGLDADLGGDRRIDEITASDLDGWLRTRDCGPRRRRNLRALLVTLWRHARRRGLLPDATTEAERTDRVRVRPGRVRIYTPDEARRLLAACPAPLVPWLAICAWSGVRSEGEIGRLLWCDVRLDRAIIDVTESKTGRRRLVPILPNLATILAACSRDGERVLGRLRRIDPQIPRIAAAAGVEWIRNGLRHSYGSYRCAITQDGPRASSEMGNSVYAVTSHHIERVDESVAMAHLQS